MDQPPRDDGNRDRATLLGLAAAVVLVVLTVLLLLKLKSDNAIQDCVAQGRHNCAPVDTNAQ